MGLDNAVDLLPEIPWGEGDGVGAIARLTDVIPMLFLALITPEGF